MNKWDMLASKVPYTSLSGVIPRVDFKNVTHPLMQKINKDKI